MSLRVLVVNLNNIKYTRDCINDLLGQTTDDFSIVLVDQNSSEEGTSDYLNSLSNTRIEVIRNSENKPLNSVWNWFHETYNEDLLCFLNNDVRLCDNFIESTLQVFDKEEKVGVVVHSTNHPKYNRKEKELNYVVVEPFVNMQGWDFTMRRELFRKIPDLFKTYCGDDFLFDNVYKREYNLAYVLSSPIIHYEGKSKPFMKTSGIEDVHNYIAKGYDHYLKINFDYSKIKPTFKEFAGTTISKEIERLYNVSLTNPSVTRCVDIYEHLPVLRRYAEQCKHVTEMGVRWGASTLALTMGKPEKLISYDIMPTPEIQHIIKHTIEMVDHDFIIADSLKIDIEETDLLFIDTLHTYNQLINELKRHSGKAKKYIILHDTTTFGRVDEEIYHHASDLVKGQEVAKRGLRTAMEDFLNSTDKWEILEDLTNNNGLTILKRVKDE